MKLRFLALAERIRSSTWARIVMIPTSTWGPIALRCVGIFVGLLVLAWIGRSATAMATATTIAPPPSTSSLDAGAPVKVPIEVASATPAAPPAPPVAFSPATRGRATPSEPVYLNHASADELRRLPGCGPKRADAIIAMRQRMGRFQRVEDLLRIKGIGRAAVRKWRPLVRLDAPPSPSDATPADAGGAGR